MLPTRDDRCGSRVAVQLHDFFSSRQQQGQIFSGLGRSSGVFLASWMWQRRNPGPRNDRPVVLNGPHRLMQRVPARDLHGDSQSFWGPRTTGRAPWRSTGVLPRVPAWSGTASSALLWTDVAGSARWDSDEMLWRIFAGALGGGFSAAGGTACFLTPPSRVGSSGGALAGIPIELIGLRVMALGGIRGPDGGGTRLAGGARVEKRAAGG